MFESSLLIDGGRAARVRSTAASAAGQCALAAGMILLSMAHTDMLTVPRLATIIGVPVAARPEVRPSGTVARRPSTGRIVLEMPALTYTSTKAEPFILADSDAPPIGDAMPWIGKGGGLPISDIIGLLPARPAPAAEAEKPKPVAKAQVTPTRINVSTGVQSARLIHQVQPVYPQLARQARIQGTVILLAVITTDGRIDSLRVESGHPLLTPAAVDAVRQWRYQPTILNEQAVEVATQIQVIFRLGP